MLRLFRVRDELVDGLLGEELAGQDSAPAKLSLCNRTGVATNIHAGLFRLYSDLSFWLVNESD